MNEIQKAKLAIKNYAQDAHISKELFYFYISRIFMRISLSALSVFIPVFIYKQYDEKITMVVLVFATIYLFQLILNPISAKLLGIFGLKPLLISGMLFAVASVASLAFPDEYLNLSVFLFAILTAIYRVLYWVPYHIDFSLLLDKKTRGRQLAFLRNFSTLIIIVAPILGGVLISSGGFAATFTYAAIIMAFALLPILKINNVYERFSWGYIETFIHLFRKENRPILLAHAANGAQAIAVVVFWPLYIYMILEGRYTSLGIITSITLIAVMFLRYLAGKMFDKWSEKRMVLVGVLFSATGWVIKVFVNTPVQIVLADTYHQFGRVVNSLTFDAATYEQSADAGKYIDEYTTLKEMALNVGRLLMLFITFFLIEIFGIKVAFILAALLTLFMILLERQTRIS